MDSLDLFRSAFTREYYLENLGPAPRFKIGIVHSTIFPEVRPEACILPVNDASDLGAVDHDILWKQVAMCEAKATVQGDASE